MSLWYCGAVVATEDIDYNDDADDEVLVQINMWIKMWTKFINQGSQQLGFVSSCPEFECQLGMLGSIVILFFFFLSFYCFSHYNDKN